MGKEKAILVSLFLFITIVSSRGQLCPKQNFGFDNVFRKYYLIDTLLDYSKQIEHLSKSEKKIIDSFFLTGTKSYDAKKLFDLFSITPISISIEDFRNISLDTVKLNARDRKLNRKSDQILKEINYKMINSQSTIKLDRKLNRKKYRTLFAKLDATFPFGYMFAPIYILDDQILVMYEIIVKGRGGSLQFVYHICKKPRGL